MKVLVLAPAFEREALLEPDRVTASLARALAARHAVTVIASCASGTPPAGWPRDWSGPLFAGPAQESGLTVRRVALPAPGALARLLARRAAAGLLDEDARAGHVVAGSACLAAERARRARERPAWLERLLLRAQDPPSGLLAALRRELGRHEALIVAGGLGVVGPEAVALARRRGKPVLLLPLLDLEDPPRSRTPLGWAKADVVGCLGPAEAALVEVLSPGARGLEVGLGLELPDPRLRPDASGFRMEHRLPHGPLVLVFGGEAARPDPALEMARRLLPRRVRVARVRSDVRQPRDEGELTLLPPLAPGPRAAANEAAALVVVFGPGGSLGLPVLEAWARRRPVIVDPRSPAAALLEPDDGILAAAPAMADEALRLLEEPARARALAEAGQRKLVARHGSDRVADRVDGALRRLAGTVRRPDREGETSLR